MSFTTYSGLARINDSYHSYTKFKNREEKGMGVPKGNNMKLGDGFKDSAV